VTSLADVPDPATPGTKLTLTAQVTDPDGAVTKVSFYRDSNGIAGLQLGSGGDTFVGTDADKAGGFSVTLNTAGLATGSYTYYALATDNGGATSAVGTAATKTVATLQPPGSISGTVYRDADNDGARDSGEAGIAGVNVYLDANGNGRPDAGERTATTDAAGRYTLSPLTSGAYTVRLVTPAGLVRTAPGEGSYSVKLGAGKNVAGRDFGAVPAASVSGRAFNDLDADGLKDSSEPGVSGFRVYLDANNNGVLDAGETSVLAGSSGTYSFGPLRPGVHVVRYASPDGWRLSSPYGYYTITLGIGQARSGVNFGFTATA